MSLLSLMRRDQALVLRQQNLNSCLVVALWNAPVHTFKHTQSTPLTTWKVWHGMGERPLLAVILLNGEVVSAKVEHLSGNEVQIGHATPQAGYLLCMRPGKSCKMTDPSAEWNIAHDFPETPIVQVVADGEIVLADITHTSPSNVQVIFPSAKSGYALMAAPNHAYIQSAPSLAWTVSHNLESFPILQVVNDAGAVVSGSIVHQSVNSVLVSSETAFMGKALAVSTGSETLNEFDVNIESTYPATTLQSGTFPAMVHFIQPSKSGIRMFAEVQVGDVILDLKHDYQLPKTAIFDIAGNKYVQKDAGSVLSEYWDVVIGNERLWRTLLLTLQR